MNQEQNQEVQEQLDVIKNDPIIKRAQEFTTNELEIAQPILDSILEILKEKCEKAGLDPKYGYMALTKALVTYGQAMCTDPDDFETSLARANELVINNIYPALGSNVGKELNTEGIVTYNGEFNRDNFTLKNIVFLAGGLLDYSFWRINYGKAIIEFTEKQQENNETIEE